MNNSDLNLTPLCIPVVTDAPHGQYNIDVFHDPSDGYTAITLSATFTPHQVEDFTVEEVDALIKGLLKARVIADKYRPINLYPSAL
ncbi:hypothetical protein [Corynebacterium hiratae]|uniref:Uncharacterized protein n=1 Tax=Corynebacterium hiratae TaxID=3139423 RepID=A0A553FUR4_9CORY|nr:hypothetical protein [Corynebacterium aurimucosum]TRX60981.1 hypothetical protein FNY97_08540 [Corynebacterium aurimucosum]